jgi:NAD(P)-dependent dehydrogenase (short-subunit alcohol dehydrogenase family)
MNTVIIGSNRGIGLELVKAYKELGHEVFALCRKSSDELNAVGVNVIEAIDVSDDNLIQEISSKLDLTQIDILIHSAGVLIGDSYPEIDFTAMRKSFEINTLGPLRTILGLKDKLKNGSKVGIVSSRVGSIADNSSSNNYAYRTSKTALNMIGKCLSLDLKEQGVSIALLHPGYVRTDMTNHNGLIDPPESARGLVEQMSKLTLEDTSIFVHTNGEKLPW